ncbi:MAG: S9 family peptidase [Gemmatimonadaceae bacterium]
MRGRATLLLLAIAAFASPATSQPSVLKRPLTHEAMWTMKRVSAPSISPDGKWVVFTVTAPAYDEKDQSADLWLVASDGTAKARRITDTRGGEGDVAWAPDSRRIAFTARRDGDDVNQIYLLDLAGGEAQRTTRLSTGAQSPHFSPDGKSLQFTSVVYPGASSDEANRIKAKEEKDRKTKVRIFDSFPIRNWDRWLDEKQVHLFVQSLDSGSVAKDLLAGTQLAALPGFGTPPVEGSRQDVDAAWTPDGKTIVFAAMSARNSAAYAEVPVELYRVDVAGGEPVRIAAGATAYTKPSFSPDGRTLYALSNANNGKSYNLSRIVAFEWPSMQNPRVVARMDRSADEYVISADGQTVYAIAEDSGLAKIFSASTLRGDAKPFSTIRRGVYGSLRAAAGAPVMVALWGSSVEPAEVVRINPGAPAPARLTGFSVAQASAIDWQSPRHFWFTSKRGRKIHNMLVLPAHFDSTKKYPLFVLIHGGAANMWRDQISLRWNYHLLARPGYVMLMTNYSGSSGFGEEFGQSIQGDPLRGPADELMEGADEAIRTFPFIDGSRQVAGGASYGGHLANALEAWSGTRFKALIAHAGLVNLEAQWGTSDVIYGRELQSLGPVWEQGEVWRTQNPVRSAASFKTPMMLSVGERDYRVPLNNTLEMWSLLQRLRIPSRLLVWPEENHWILNPENSRLFYREVEGWLARWVKAGSE